MNKRTKHNSSAVACMVSKLIIPFASSRLRYYSSKRMCHRKTVLVSQVLGTFATHYQESGICGFEHSRILNLHVRQESDVPVLGEN